MFIVFAMFILRLGGHCSYRNLDSSSVQPKMKGSLVLDDVVSVFEAFF